MADVSGTAPEGSDTPHNFAEAVSLLQSLIARRKLLKDTLKSPAVAFAFNSIGNALRTGEKEQRLQATSMLGKAAEISRPVAALVLPLLRDGLHNPLPPIGSWGTADDRYYLAKGIFVCSELWIPAYAAFELAGAEVAERKSRGIWANIAINRAASLATALDTVAKGLSADRTDSVDTRCRKLNRITNALSELLPLADVPTGEGFGKALSALVAEAGDSNGPENRSLRQETAINIFDLMIQMLRLRFTATLDSDVYHAARMVLGWWKPANPPQAVDSRAERIVRIAMDSLHTLARQGVSQRNLRQAIAGAFGAERVNRAGSDIVSTDPSLDPTIASWLSNGREPIDSKSNTAVRELNEQEFDELLGRLLITVDDQEGEAQSLQLMADRLEILEPTHFAAIRATAMKTRLIAQWAQAIGSKRWLSLLGQRGDLVQYDPAVHETHDDIQLSARARIIAPGVVKKQPGRPAQVVLKIQVGAP